MSAYRLSLIVALLFPAVLAGRVLAAPDKEPVLTAEDKKYLDGLMKEFLFDPKGAERVSIKTIVRTVWAKAGEVEAEGWLVPGKEGKPGRIYFTDGASIPAPPEKEMKKVDFVATCQARYAPKKADAEEKNTPDQDSPFPKMRLTAVGHVDVHDMALAAWLYRLGHEGLAAQAFAAARKGKGDPRQRLREELAWSAFAKMVHAYMVRADEEALAHGERLLRLYADEVKARCEPTAHRLVGKVVLPPLSRHVECLRGPPAVAVQVSVTRSAVCRASASGRGRSGTRSVAHAWCPPPNAGTDPDAASLPGRTGSAA